MLSDVLFVLLVIVVCVVAFFISVATSSPAVFVAVMNISGSSSRDTGRSFRCLMEMSRSR